MKKINITTICNCVCALLLLAALVTQFLPYWTCAENCKKHKDVEKSVSVAEYLWLPEHHAPLKDELTELYRDIYGHDYKDPVTGKKLTFKADFIMPATLTIFLGSIAGIIFCVLYRKKFFTMAISVIVGIAGIIGFTSYPALTMNPVSSTYTIFFIALTAIAAISLIISLIPIIRENALKKRSSKNNAM